jgi:hypothetical protein
LTSGHKSLTHHLFLTTSPDQTKANNLDVIAETNECPLSDDSVYWV